MEKEISMENRKRSKNENRPAGKMTKILAAALAFLLLFSMCVFAAEPADDPYLKQKAAEQKAAEGQYSAGTAETSGQTGPNGAGTAAGTGADTIVWSNGRQVDLTKPMVALTFDDGPQTTSGGRILDTFAAYGQRATFFLVGDRIPSRAAEVQRMKAEGHEIGNHTYSHTYLNKVGAETIRSQVAKCNETVAATTGTAPILMRLPGGNKNSTVLANVGMPIILWNVDTQDWKYRNADHVKGAVIGKIKDGDIVLMHELYASTATAVETIVPTLVSQGFQLVTVSELAQFRGYALAPGQIYYSFPAK